MFKNLVKMVVGSPTERMIARYREVVEKINALEPSMQALTPEAVRAKTEDLKQRAQSGTPLEDLLPEAFALVREAGKRTIGQRHFDVQLIGGMVLHEGKIAEMKTGEGKTLSATLPLYLNALLGKGVHLVTPNDYLSKVGVQTMGPIYHYLGLSVGVIQNSAGDPNTGSFIYDPEFPSNDARFQSLRPVKRAEAYRADITYGTNNEFGFDYLRDNMAMDISQLTQRELHYAIVDEVDNILIDEARTPLIISGQADEPSDLYARFSRIVRTLKPSSQQSIDDKTPDGDYVVDEKDRVSYLTEAGVEKVERAMGFDQLYHADHADVIPYLDNALRAMTLYHRDKEYIVQDDQIVIVDEFTGRLMVGRRFSEGLHQAIEAKEGVKVRRENMTMATITFQNFFRMYKKLAGMTGTAATESEEFEKIYNLEVMPIPTHRQMIRKDFDDLVYPTYESKFKAIVDEIKERQGRGQPVLVGTVAIETSEHLSKLLKKAGVDHQVLNAKQHEREAEIITQAGRPGTVTIATNMAGRGVDILLGGNPEGLARTDLRQQGIEITDATPEQWQAALTKARAIAERDRQKVIELGGLFVLGTERHEARRIDNQLRGRSGRQGDPGESRFYLSLEDDLMRRFGGDRVKGVMNMVKMPEGEPIEHKWITSSISQAQVRVEGYHFDMRKRVLEYDDVVNKQREVIYRQRRELLTRDDIRDDYLKTLDEEIGKLVDEFTPDEFDRSTWDIEALYRRAFTLFPLPEQITLETLEAQTSVDDLETLLTEAVREAYDRKAQGMGPGVMPRLERFVMLDAIDAHWRRHLTDLDVLREGIGLVSIAQRDPLVEYKREAFGMYQELQDQIRLQAVRNIFRVQVNVQQPVAPRPVMRAQPVQAVAGGATAPAKAEPVRKTNKLGRNDPCWCGSGKKYKDCHWKQDRVGKVN
jgi:preprotein translocase subunit SecA